ncbi:TIGR04222 domain-containing membrane protein [Peterkaempfera sp. SMS 1(5)a]|uniref:TIGR04222 domain-containing membrane protein n=1 Tax=Peterkaempfera podocarpi TaxID=3232308 RepID=UPI00366F2C0C
MWLLLLLAACTVTVLSCVHLVGVVAAADLSAEDDTRPPDGSVRIGLYETAYLAGGPERVVDLAMVLMAAQRRLHPAHTGWTTVVDPQGRDGMERDLITAVGPDGQCRTGDLRQALVESPAVREIGARLALAGLATPAAVRERAVDAVSRVRRSLLLTVVLLGACLGLGEGGGGQLPAVLSWFSLPLILGSGTLLMSRVDVRPYTRWATPAGREVLREVRIPGPGDERQLLTAVAVSGPSAVPDPLLRAALRAPRR